MKFQTFNKKRQLTLKYKCGGRQDPLFHLTLPLSSAGRKAMKAKPRGRPWILGPSLGPRSQPWGTLLALQPQRWAVESRCQSSQKPGALQCRRPDCGTPAAGGLRRAEGDKDGNLRGAAAASALRCHPPGPGCALPPAGGWRRLREVAAQGGGRKNAPDAGGDARMEDGPVGDPAARPETSRPARCTVVAVEPATPRPAVKVPVGGTVSGINAGSRQSPSGRPSGAIVSSVFCHLPSPARAFWKNIQV